MKKKSDIIKNSAISALILIISFGISLGWQKVFHTSTTITTVFVFAVFLVSLLTDGYLYGFFAAIISVIAVNYAFTFPFFKLNFTIPENSFAALIMIVIALVTSALTTKIKRQEMFRTQGERERMRANLLRAVSHDLRTPLTTIYGASSAIIENGNSFTKEQIINMAGNIKEDAEWLIHMVENLLSITKIDAGNVKIIKSPTVLDELLDSVLQKFKKRYPEQSVEIDIPDEIVVIPMDAVLIEQVIENILENAVQHAVGMTKLSVKVFTFSKEAVFEISDNGCGIPKEKLKTIFTGYCNIEDKSADNTKRNAGIGLSVCETIIKAHGGEITAKNAKNGGAVFRFTLEKEDALIEQ